MFEQFDNFANGLRMGSHRHGTDYSERTGSETAYVDQFSVYQFTVAPVMAGKVILTRTDMIKF